MARRRARGRPGGRRRRGAPDDLRGDVRARGPHRRDQPRPGLPRRRRPGPRDRGRGRRAAIRAQPVPARRRDPRAARGGRGAPEPPLRAGLGPRHGGARDHRCDRGDRRGGARLRRAGRRGGRDRAVLRLLCRGGGAGRGSPGDRRPGAGRRVRRLRSGPGGPACRLRSADPAGAGQLPAQPDRNGADCRRPDRAGAPGHRRRRRRGHRRGLRAPDLRRRRARPDRDAARDGRAHPDGVLRGQDPVVHRLEGGLGDRAGRAGDRRPDRQAVPHLHLGCPAPARGRGRPGRSGRAGGGVRARSRGVPRRAAGPAVRRADGRGVRRRRAVRDLLRRGGRRGVRRRRRTALPGAAGAGGGGGRPGERVLRRGFADRQGLALLGPVHLRQAGRRAPRGRVPLAGLR